jgi:hypothetical protein
MRSCRAQACDWSGPGEVLGRRSWDPPTRHGPNPASGERQVSGNPVRYSEVSDPRMVGAETVFRTEIATIGQRGRAVFRHSVDADVDPPVDQRVVRAIGGRKNLRPPVGNVDDPSQESKRALRGVRARIACPVS